MKKLFFSAVALVAFSSVSMANTVEKETESLKIVVSTVCDSIAYDTYHTWYGNGFSDEVAREKAKQAKADCEKELAKPKLGFE
ncbi:hypothetical protein IVB69_07430 [Flavobacterium sp. J49]|uniref:hypothetical protein n=1 Tax=Flavobacterium sp. J49 TaxID=2718534 RepID=UPI0015941760|nr:hypothetical protein [Flavobacterium sp. J49]MBF6641307.1 hypothetical protein [Flavobacterium sp. J49]NIC02554.1 hypothetical protein [Flavobacterium sp. J49]